jgi:hypothetical protein
MTRKSYPRFATLLPLLWMLVLVFVPSASAEWKEKVLYSFQGGTDGSTPAGGVILDKKGNLYLYGATTDGGSNNCPGIAQCGTVFQLEPPAKQGDPWTENQLYIFKGKNSNDGETPAGGVIFDQAGNLYGTTAYGGSGGCVLLGTTVGCGTVFQMKPPQTKGGAWIETVLYSFQGGKDGYVPQGNLTFDSAGNLYGVTLYGGGYGSCNAPYYEYCGTVFKLSPPKTRGGKWKERVLYSFKSGMDGANPNGGLVFDTNGALYGTTYAGGNQRCRGDAYVGCGTVFALQPPFEKGGAWKEKWLRRFDVEDGANPVAGIVFDRKRNLYGTTFLGPQNGFGLIFELNKPLEKSASWTETVLHRFSDGDDGAGPMAGVIFDPSGNLYGTTATATNRSAQGNVFRMMPSTNSGPRAFGVLHTFSGAPDGARPTAALTFDSKHNLYSTTEPGGTGQPCEGGCGTVFEVSP